MKLRFDKEKAKKLGIVLGSTFASLYLLFLILPFILSPIANSYCDKISDLIKSSTGFDTKIEGLGIVTAPNLSAGVKVKSFSMSIPSSDEPLISTEKFNIRIALLPLVLKKIQLDNISAKTLNSTLVVKKDGEFLFEDYLPQTNEQETSSMKQTSKR